MTEAKSATPSPDSQDDARRFLVKLLRAELDRYDEVLAQRGRTLLRSIQRLQWVSEDRRFVIEVDDYSSRTVQVDLPWSFDETLEASCECRRLGPMGFEIWGAPVATGRGGRCAHVYAALSAVLRFLESESDDPIARDALCLDGAWRRTLFVLDQFLVRQRATAAEEAHSERRLTWRVGSDRHGRFFVGAWEQKLSRGGKWSRGRKVPWDDIMYGHRLPLTENDQRVRQAVRTSTEDRWGYYGEWSPNPVGAAAALVGHPLVFHLGDPTFPLTVEEAELALEVDSPSGDGVLVLSASLGGWPLDDILQCDQAQSEGKVAALVDVEDRVLIGSAEPRVLDLLTRLGREARPIPAEGKEELFERLAGLESFVPLKVGPSLTGEPRPADGRLFLLLAPLEPHGLSAEIRVRPAGRGELLPGRGDERLSAFSDDGLAVFVRRLDDERAAADELRRRLDLPEQADWQWRIDDDERALDLVAAAQSAAAEDLVTVEWPAGARRRVRGYLGPQALKVKIEDRRDWFGLAGAAEVEGGGSVPLGVLLAALRSGQRYVALGEGDWVEVSEQLRERLRGLDDVVHTRRERLEIDATAALAMRDLVGEDDLVDVEAPARFRALLDRLSLVEAADPDPPEELQAELRDYQLAGYRWLWRLAIWGVGGCLADDMGLGKTVQALAILLDRGDRGPALVVAPTSVGFNWLREIERFAPSLEARFYRGPNRRKLLEDLGEDVVVVTSYGLLQRDVKRLAEVRWGTFVLDEAQAIKNAQTKTAQAARKVDAEWRLALTGTPIENHLGELWSLYRVISPGLFGSWEAFRERWAEPIERRNDDERRQALARRVRPFLLRRTKDEVLTELPERTEVELWAELSPAEEKLYDEARLEALAGLTAPSDGRDQRFEVLAALTRLRQLACHPALVDAGWKKGSAKLELFLETVDELREGEHRALVFSQFTRHLDLVRKALEKRGVSYLYLDGQTPAKERERRVDAFQAGEGELFLISLKAGGTGLNLTGANYVLLLDPWWNPAVEDQASDRAHRIGQTRAVTVYRLVTRGTIEEEILRLHADKRHLVSGILDGTDRAAKLSTEELVQLIRSG